MHHAFVFSCTFSTIQGYLFSYELLKKKILVQLFYTLNFQDI